MFPAQFIYMTTLQKITQLEMEVTHLKSLFSALIPLDKEGVYKDTFVQDMKQKMREKVEGTFSKKGDLLKLLR